MKGQPSPLIAHVIYRLDVGGLENGLVNLVNWLPSERYRHAIVCLAGFNPEFRARIRDPGVAVWSLDKRPGKDPRAYVRYWRLLRRLQPDIVHTRNLGTIDMQWVAAAAGIAQRVHGEHGWEASDPLGRGWRSLVIRRACRPVIRRYVPMSRDIGRWLVSAVGVDPARVTQVYSGVDTERFAPAGTLSGLARRSVHIGTVGRLDPVKNHGALVESVERLAAAGHDVHLTIVGDGPLRAELESSSQRLVRGGRAALIGSRGDTPDLLRGFDIFALPSLNEGISNTILEAMATGLPVVAARVGGNPELVDDGITGRLYDPANPRGLEGALLAYVTDSALRAAHGAAGRDRVMQNFSRRAMVERYLDVYDELMGGWVPKCAE